MNRPRPAQENDLDVLFAGNNPFSACSMPAQQELRAVLLRHLDNLRTIAVRPRAILDVQAHSLYGVLSGSVSLNMTSRAAKRLMLRTYHPGDIFGDFECPRPVRHLRVVPAFPTERDGPCLLQCNGDVVRSLLRVSGFERQLCAGANRHLRVSVSIMSLRLLKEPGLIMAYLCLSPVCGLEAKPHGTLRYCGQPVTEKKRIVHREFEQLGGLSRSYVRKWIQTHKSCGYIDTQPVSSCRHDGTHLTILKPLELIKALYALAPLDT